MSILIVTWNSAAHIENCLRSLENSVGGSIDIIVVDNNSSDSTPEIVRRFTNVELIETGANLGFAPAMNIAIRRASGSLVCILNPDTVVSPSALDTLKTFLERNPSVIAVGPRQVDERGNLVSAGARPFPSIWESFARQFGIAKVLPEALLVGRQVHDALHSEIPISVPALTGAALVLRKASIVEIGLLDETIPMYFEDLDYCARLLKKGSLYYLPEAVVVHLGGKSADVAPVRKLLYAMENGEAPWLYFRRYGSNPTSFLFRALMFAGSLFRLLLLLPTYGGARRMGIPIHPSLHRVRARSAAMLWWSVCPRSRFQESINCFFEKNALSKGSPQNVDSIASRGESTP
jgi:GT2 family glycosyltransferase